MGAWSAEMMGNDTALDAVGKYQDFRGSKITMNAAGKEIVAGRTSLANVLKRHKGKKWDSTLAQEVLGLAEYFMKAGAKLDAAAKEIVLEAIAFEESPAIMQEWGCDQGRIAALAEFKSRIAKS